MENITIEENHRNWRDALFLKRIDMSRPDSYYLYVIAHIWLYMFIWRYMYMALYVYGITTNMIIYICPSLFTNRAG